MSSSSAMSIGTARTRVICLARMHIRLHVDVISLATDIFVVEVRERERDREKRERDALWSFGCFMRPVRRDALLRTCCLVELDVLYVQYS